MMYALLDLQTRLLAPFADAAAAGASWLGGSPLYPARVGQANLSLLHRMMRGFPRQPWGIGGVTEQIVAETPFCRLIHFAPTTGTARGPRVLVCAPLSGHHATLVRDTVATLLGDHDVYLTDWLDARDVPIAQGVFHLADYVALIRRFVSELGARDLHVVAVCQPTVPVLAAVALSAAAGEPTPRSLTLMGGPIDARVNPTVVNQLATDHPIEWFASQMIHQVPGHYAGAGRAVYPGFLQLTAFVMMNAQKHAEAYVRYWVDTLTGDAAATAAHEKFYDEYNAVLDMDAAYYLETVRLVFQEFALARGTWEIDGALVRPAAIRDTALFTIEGALDDISGLGQTAAAHALCSGIPEAQHGTLIAEGCGHYGLFSGSRWREKIYPEVRGFIQGASS
jgi:poly(3-hydroxybutyrate) depolymerase